LFSSLAKLCKAGAKLGRLVNETLLIYLTS
jgi:hypothetical protein